MIDVRLHLAGAFLVEAAAPEEATHVNVYPRGFDPRTPRHARSRRSFAMPDSSPLLLDRLHDELDRAHELPPLRDFLLQLPAPLWRQPVVAGAAIVFRRGPVRVHP